MKPLTRHFGPLALGLSLFFASGAAWADKVAVLPFTSGNNTARPELEEARRWTRDAVVKMSHTPATPDEMVSAEASVKDGVADTRQEYVTAGKAANAQWTLVARVERDDHPPAKLPDGSEEEGYTTYRFELEACQVDSGRVESLSRELLVEEATADIAEMLGLLLRPEGIANAEIPWERSARRPKPKPKPKAPEPPPPPPAEPSPPPPPAKIVYGDKRPIALALVGGFTTAIERPSQARGPTAAMPIGVAFGYALPDAAPGLELRAELTSQVLGPGAVEIAGGARYALAPISGVRFFVGPELLAGAHVALGGDKATRFLAQGGAFVAVGVTELLQLEAAGELAGAFGGSGTLFLGGGSGRVTVRF